MERYGSAIFRYAFSVLAQRELMEKVYFEERGFTAIARVKGVCECVILNRMKRILTKLKKLRDCPVRGCGFAWASALASVR